MKLVNAENLFQIVGGVNDPKVSEEAKTIVQKLKAIYQLTEELTGQLDIFEDEVFAAMKRRDKV